MPGCFRPTSATQIISTHPHPRSRRSRDCSNLHSSLVRSDRFTPVDPLRRDRSSTCKLFTCEPRGDLRHLTPLSPSPPAHRGLSTTRVPAPGLPRPAHQCRRDAKPMTMTRDAFRRTLFERHSLRRRPASLARRLGPVSNIGALGGTPPLIAVGFFSPSQAHAHPKVRGRCSHSASPCPRPRNR
jgi:hypothetical protein